MTPPDALAQFEAEGFRGFLTIGQLHGEGCLGVPDERGVYVVLARGDSPHEFRAQSSAPVWRGTEPTVPVAELAARWVEGAALLYVGRAPGPGVRSRLRQRIKRYLRFGHGRVVAHWGGRFIWQLREPNRLAIAWRVCTDAEDPAALEAGLLRRFEQRHGALPFSNLRAAPGAADEND